MKTTVTLDIEPSDLRYEMQEVIKELVKDEILQMIKTYARKRVKEEVDKMVEPIMVEMLTNENFTFSAGTYSQHHKTINSRIREVTKSYFDERVYLFSRTSNLMSERYAKTSSNGSSEPTRIQAFMQECVKNYFDTDLKEHIASKLDDIVDNKTKIQDAVKEQLQSLVNSKLK